MQGFDMNGFFQFFPSHFFQKRAIRDCFSWTVGRSVSCKVVQLVDGNLLVRLVLVVFGSLPLHICINAHNKNMANSCWFWTSWREQWLSDKLYLQPTHDQSDLFVRNELEVLESCFKGLAPSTSNTPLTKQRVNAIIHTKSFNLS